MFKNMIVKESKTTGCPGDCVNCIYKDDSDKCEDIPYRNQKLSIFEKDLSTFKKELSILEELDHPVNYPSVAEIQTAPVTNHESSNIPF